jgi:hypothetical protein
MDVFWGVALVDIDRHFRAVHCLHRQTDSSQCRLVAINVVLKKLAAGLFRVESVGNRNVGSSFEKLVFFIAFKVRQPEGCNKLRLYI